jgi:Dimerisation domain/O-methyltransferase domain
MSGPTPEKIMQITTGGWATSILGSAARHGIFNALEGNPAGAEEVAKKAQISPRGAQALLDGLTGLGLLTLSEGRYQNSPEASQFLVKGKPGYLGGMSEVFLQDFATWQNMPEAVKTGMPVAKVTTDVADSDFWHLLVPAIAALSFPVAQMAAERLGVGKAGAVSWLDVGGGSGVWSAAWLGVNKQATGYQLDWAGVNKISRGYVSNFGVADRFQTIDGDFHATDFGSAKYEFAIYAHIAHQEPPAENLATFRKFRKAIKPGGTLVVNDFILADDRTGHPFAMMFASQMLVATKNGFTYRETDYRKWLGEAGFQSVEIVPTPTPSTLIFAR